MILVFYGFSTFVGHFYLFFNLCLFNSFKKEFLWHLGFPISVGFRCSGPSLSYGVFFKGVVPMWLGFFIAMLCGSYGDPILDPSECSQSFIPKRSQWEDHVTFFFFIVSFFFFRRTGFLDTTFGNEQFRLSIWNLKGAAWRLYQDYRKGQLIGLDSILYFLMNIWY